MPSICTKNALPSFTQHQMPIVFWYTLFCLVGITMLIGGYDEGVSGSRRSVTIGI
jgi:hypothetical protein